MIKVIAFDYGGVLGCEADDWKNTFKKVLEVSGLSYQEMLKNWEKHWPKLKIGKEEINKFWNGSEKLRKLYNNSITIDKQMLEFAKSLKENYKLVILSNDSKDWMDAKIKRFNLNNIFSKIYCSGKIGLTKPDKEIFEYVLNDLKIKPGELLFIDNQENNIESAKKLRIQTILFTNINKLKEDLKFFSYT